MRSLILVLFFIILLSKTESQKNYLRDFYIEGFKESSKLTKRQNSVDETVETTTRISSIVEDTTTAFEETTWQPDNHGFDDETLEVRQNFRDRPNCGATYSLTSFTLVQEEDAENTVCRFLVKRPVTSICKLHLTFNEFELPVKNESDHCDGSLKIHNEEFCGNLTGTSQEISLNDEVELEFETFGAFYNITVRQIDCSYKNIPIAESSPLEEYGKGSIQPKDDHVRDSIRDDDRCNQLFDSKEFMLQSPNYPNPYPDNVDCEAIIYPYNDNICSLELRFDEFRVEPSNQIDECLNDYLEISDDEPLSQPLRCCGIFAGVRLVEFGRLKRFRFHSNSRISDVGYSIFVKQVPCRGSNTPEISSTESSVGRTPKPIEEFPTYATTTASSSVVIPTTTPAYIKDDFLPPVTTSSTYRPPVEEFPVNSLGPSGFETLKPALCARTYPLPARLTSPNFPAQYIDNESCDYYVDISGENVCFLKVDFISFSLKSSVGCREDYLEISGSRICGVQSGSVLFPVEPNREKQKLSFRSNASGRGDGFEIEVSALSCDFHNEEPTDAIIVGGAPAEYGSPILQPDFVSPDSEYGAPNDYTDPEFPSPGPVLPVQVETSYGSPTYEVGSYGAPIISVDSIFYGSTQNSSFGRQPYPAFIDNPFLSSVQSHTIDTDTLSHGNQPASEILVINDIDSYGAPQGPVISPSSALPAFDGHRPSYNDFPNTPVTSRPPFNPQVPQYPTSRPNFNPGPQLLDSYGVPLAPLLTERPTYNPPNRPLYRPRPGKSQNFLGPIGDLIDAKRRAVAKFLSGIRFPKFFGARRPSFHFSPLGKRPTSSRPAHGRPGYGYNAPSAPVVTNRPTYLPVPSHARPPRGSGVSGDPRIDIDIEDVDQTIECGDPLIDTFAENFVFTSPGYPDNYPDSYNCTLNIFPRKEVCALSLELEDFIIEDSAYCRSDFVAVGSRSELNKKRICGQQSYRILELAAPLQYLEPWVLDFKSDSAGHQRGFSIRATQILCSQIDLEPSGLFDVDNCAVEEVTEISGLISSHVMQKDDICVYELVRQPGMCSVTFVVDGLTPSSQCGQNFVEINKSQFCASGQGISIHEFAFENEERMKFERFLTQREFSANWTINFRQNPCSQNLTPK